MFYNWDLRTGQWRQFLHAIEQDELPESLMPEEDIEDVKEVETKDVEEVKEVEDGTTS